MGNSLQWPPNIFTKQTNKHKIRVKNGKTRQTRHTIFTVFAVFLLCFYVLCLLSAPICQNKFLVGVNLLFWFWFWFSLDMRDSPLWGPSWPTCQRRRRQRSPGRGCGWALGAHRCWRGAGSSSSPAPAARSSLRAGPDPPFCSHLPTPRWGWNHWAVVPSAQWHLKTYIIICLWW